MVQESQVLDFVGDIYSAALDGARWPAVLTALADLLGGLDTTLEVHRDVGARPLFFTAGNRLPELGVDDYLGHYASICPRIPYLATLAAGSVGHDLDFISEQQMDRDAFYADFLGPDDLRYFAAGILINQPGMLGGAYVHRTPRQGAADKATLSLLKQLVPHLSRALDLHFQLESQHARETRFLDLIGRLPKAIVTLDDQGDVLFANEAAAAAIRKGDGLVLLGRRLHLSDAAANRRMAVALKDVLTDALAVEPSINSQVFAPRPSGHAPYVLAVHRLSGFRAVYEDPAAPAAVVFIHDPELPGQISAPALAQTFSLTRRESELALALLQGRTLREQADSRGVKVSTERTHLKSLLQKTGTHRQTDLVRLLARFVT